MERRLLLSLLPLTLFAVVAWPGAAPRAEEPVPNVVIVLADDLGFGDVHALNPSSSIPTPNLDRLAAEGMRFTEGHSPSAVCTPTRYGLVTGRYCWRSRLTSGVLNGYSEHLIDPARLTIADVFLNAGYRTACFGKWHLGMDLPRREGATKKDEVDYTGRIANGPLALGFERFFGVTASLDMPPYVWVEDDGFTAPPTGQRPGQGFPAYMRAGPVAADFDPQAALDTIVGKATAWIAERAAAQERFFLYLPLTSPHKPVLPAERFAGRSKLGPYGDFVMQTDDAVGRVLRALDEAEVAKDTLVFFSSDNASFMYRLDAPECPPKQAGRRDASSEDGPDHADDARIQGYASSTHRANGPFRGTKADAWDGGHHVAFFVRWPGHVAAGTANAEPLCLTDLLATGAELVGAPLPIDAAEDSFSLLPLLLGKERETPRAAVVHHSGNGTFAVRQGRWKLIFGSGSGGRGQPPSKPFDGGVQLYDMHADPGETTNLAEKQPARVAELTALLERYRAEGRSRPAAER